MHMFVKTEINIVKNTGSNLAKSKVQRGKRAGKFTRFWEYYARVCETEEENRRRLST